MWLVIMIDISEIENIYTTFEYKGLISTEYFQKYKQAYIATYGTKLFNYYRNYYNLTKYLNEIFEYNKEHANGFAKRLRAESKDWNNCEAIFAEIIVYRSYIRLVYQGILKSISKENDECDLILELSDGSLSYLEIFCVMPTIRMPEKSGEIVIEKLNTHTQNELASIRQKIFHKIEKQKQLTKQRNNYLVIELNESLIANDFMILSSLSDGYKITFNKYTSEVLGEGFDWSNSIFNDERLKNLKGIIYFFLGNYESHKILINQNYNSTT